MGVREIGSSNARLIDLQEAESGGFDLVSLHVTVDGAGEVEWYAESSGGERLFHPIGWWLVTP
jgi:hypothetical protein